MTTVNAPSSPVSRRPNLVDAAILLVLVIMIPLAYGAYLLFRTPQPRLQTVSPTTIVQGTTPRLLIYGSNLRPYMRISLNDVQAVNFMIGSVTGAEADLPALRPGTYDVVLYDYAQEVSRLPKAVTVVPSMPTPAVEMIVGGAFTAVDASSLDALKPGATLPQGDGSPANGTADIVEVGTPQPGALRVRVGDAVIPTRVPSGYLVPATIRVRCFTETNQDGTVRCSVPSAQPPGSVPLNADAVLVFHSPRQWFSFQVFDAHSDVQPPIAVAHLRVLVSRELARQIKVDDIDAAAAGYAATIAPRVVAVGEPQAAPSSAASAVTGEAPVFVDVTLRLPVEAAARGGWTYRGRPLKAGDSLAFETRSYAMSGVVASYTVEDTRR
jgi:hypothetical protein